MKKHIIGMAAIVMLVAAAAQAQPQPGTVTLGPAAAGTREVGVAFAGWSMAETGRTAGAAAARYTYNFSEAFALEGGAEVGSAGSRPFGATSVQLRLTPVVRPYGPSTFYTFGIVGATAPGGSPMPRGWAQSVGMGVQGPLSGNHALRLEVQAIGFGGLSHPSEVGLRVACTFVTGRD